MGIGQMWRMWTWATSWPAASARRTAWWIGPKVEPQPTTASFAPSRPRQTSWSGIEFGDAQHLGGAGVGHLLVRVRRIVDVAGARLLLDAADAVLEAWRSGLDPRPREVVVAGDTA